MQKPIWLIKISGAVIDDAHALTAFCEVVAKVSQDVHIIIVHGGGLVIDRWMEQADLTIEKYEGMRKTTAEAMPYVAGVLAGYMNKSLVASLMKHRCSSIGLSLADGQMLETPSQNADPLGLVGYPALSDNANMNWINLLIENQQIPVISSVGCDQNFNLVNVNADDAACALANTFNVDKVFLITNAEGVLDQDQQRIPQLAISQIKALVATGVVSDGMIAKLQSVRTLLEKKPCEVFIANLEGLQQKSLSQSKECGTQVVL
ncbi:MAG: acetylglutamate kinase [Pseudomonadota bacterium]